MFKCGVRVWVGGSVGWGVDRGVVVGVVSSDELILELDDGHDMGYTHGKFDGSNYIKPVS